MIILTSGRRPLMTYSFAQTGLRAMDHDNDTGDVHRPKYDTTMTMINDTGDDDAKPAFLPSDGSRRSTFRPKLAFVPQRPVQDALATNLSPKLAFTP